MGMSIDSKVLSAWLLPRVNNAFERERMGGGLRAPVCIATEL